MNESKYRKIKCRGRNGYFTAKEIDVQCFEDSSGFWDHNSSHVIEIDITSKRIGGRPPIMLRGASGHILSTLRQIVENAEQDLLRRKEVEAALKQMWEEKKHLLQAVKYIRQLTGWLPSKCKKYAETVYNYYDSKAKEAMNNIPLFRHSVP